MQLDTKYFGQITCEDDDILHFGDGLFGFEEEKSFVLLPFDGSDGSLLCLQSVKTPHLAFVTMNPFFLKPDYAPQLTAEQLCAMGVQRSQDLCYYVLCAVRQPVSGSTVNLRCPIVINDETRRACQVILEGQQYGMRHLLSEFSRKDGEGSAC